MSMPFAQQRQSAGSPPPLSWRLFTREESGDDDYRCEHGAVMRFSCTFTGTDCHPHPHLVCAFRYSQGSAGR